VGLPDESGVPAVVSGTPTKDGGANLPVCPNLSASKRSDAGGTMGIRTRKNIAPLVLVEIWAAWQRRPTWWWCQNAPMMRAHLTFCAGFSGSH
jgi:hypothetical protein